jgi:hypothetical protein
MTDVPRPARTLIGHQTVITPVAFGSESAPDGIGHCTKNVLFFGQKWAVFEI